MRSSITQLVFALFFWVSNAQAQVSSAEGMTPLEGVQISRPSNMISDAQREDKYWSDVKAVGNKEAFEAYINAYPRGRYVNLAKANISRSLPTLYSSDYLKSGHIYYPKS